MPTLPCCLPSYVQWHFATLRALLCPPRTYVPHPIDKRSTVLERIAVVSRKQRVLPSRETQVDDSHAGARRATGSSVKPAHRDEMYSIDTVDAANIASIDAELDARTPAAVGPRSQPVAEWPGPSMAGRVTNFVKSSAEPESAQVSNPRLTIDPVESSTLAVNRSWHAIITRVSRRFFGPPNYSVNAGATSRVFGALIALVGALLVTALLAFGTITLATVRPTARSRVPPPTPTAATLAVTSNVEGSAVRVDNVERGVTPLRLSLDPGEHTVTIATAQVSRSLKISLKAGEVSSQHVEFAAPPSPTTGQMQITSEPSGARVTVDGVARGTTPVTLEGIAAGPHRVLLTGEGVRVERTITTAAGETARVWAALAPAARVAPLASARTGLVRVSAPIELDIFENGKLIGGTGTMLEFSSGRHELEAINSALQFRTALSVIANPGQPLVASVQLPNGSVSLNAVPWASVAIDGQEVGVTPLANVAVPIGSHEIIWRHPEFGERRRQLTVPFQKPVRASIDFTRE